MTELKNFDEELVAIRHDMHRNPELGLDELWTSDYVAKKLKAMGYTVHRGLAKTGIVAQMKCGASDKAIGIRADFDALPIQEETGKPYQSTIDGKMHACGHDGHTAMLLGAAKMLAERKNFDGTLNLIFQPAEENFGGAKIMVDEGLFERFPCDAVFGLHNEPALPFGEFWFRDGPIMAAVDEAKIIITGFGGHGAHPESCSDPMVTAASIVMALQTIVSRNVSPHEKAVVTVGSIHGGSASNIIPETAEIVIGIRSFTPETRDLLEQRIREIADFQAKSFGQTAEVIYERSYDPTINDAGQTAFARDLAKRFAGEDKVKDLENPFMGSEDFAYFLNERPGTYFFLGARQSNDDKPLHHPQYDFNDGLLPIGASFWTELAEAFLPVKS